MRDALLTPVPTKKPKVSVVMDEDLKAALEAWAAQESRTVFTLCELILRDTARETSYLKQSLEASRSPIPRMDFFKRAKFILFRVVLHLLIFPYQF